MERYYMVEVKFSITTGEQMDTFRLQEMIEERMGELYHKLEAQLRPNHIHQHRLKVEEH